MTDTEGEARWKKEYTNEGGLDAVLMHCSLRCYLLFLCTIRIAFNVCFFIQAPAVAATEAAPPKAPEVEKEIIGESSRGSMEAGKLKMLQNAIEISNKKKSTQPENSVKKEKNVLIREKTQMNGVIALAS